MGLYAIDFETTTDKKDCRVWAWGICEVGNPDSFTYGNTIDTFFEHVKGLKDNPTLYVHNMKFDGDFVFNYLFRNGFQHSRPPKQEKRGERTRAPELPMTFTTLISDMGQFYTAKIIFEKKGKKTKYARIIDSYKILPFSVADVAKAFGLPFQKLELDYTTYREPGHILTDKEVQYLKHDVVIMALALDQMFMQGLTKMTQASNAFNDYKEMIGKYTFRDWFPTPDYFTDEQIRKSYKGGYTYVKPEYSEKDIGEGIVMDINSLYPWAMATCPLPQGKPLFFRGKYKPRKDYPLYIQCITCGFDLKPGHLPTIQIKGKSSRFQFCPTEYLTTSGDRDDVTLYLTSVDLELFEKHYTIHNPEYGGGWMFRQSTEMFTGYINKWMEQKIEAARTGNKGMRTSAKLMLNSLYGRFALNPKVKSKNPYLDESGTVRYETDEDYTYRGPIYIPVGTFITAWARYKTITSAQKMYQYFVYADTDSLHLRLDLPQEIREMDAHELEQLTTADLKRYGVPIPDDFEVDPYALGAWKVESKFSRARFIRAKSYIEDSNPPETWDKPRYSTAAVRDCCEDFNINPAEQFAFFKDCYDSDALKITCAGLPSNCYPQVTWENFHGGVTYSGKLQPKHVPGGIVLEPTNYTIKKN